MRDVVMNFDSRTNRLSAGGGDEPSAAADGLAAGAAAARAAEGAVSPRSGLCRGCLSRGLAGLDGGWIDDDEDESLK